MSSGLFITFEGIDGSGKSTQSARLADRLRLSDFEVVQTREPGGSTGAEEIRSLLVEGETSRWSPETELLLFNAARRDHIEKTVRPSLENGQVVVCDRYVDSTRVYQGVARADLREKVDALHMLMIGLEADLTFIIDTDPEHSLTRGLARSSGEDRFEEFGLQFQKDLRAGFLELGATYPNRCHIIDGMRSIEEIATDVMAITRAKLP